ncbi:hypothetical protein Ancab_024849, partial [Ancistrocladus abbreviatus]
EGIRPSQASSEDHEVTPWAVASRGLVKSMPRKNPKLRPNVNIHSTIFAKTSSPFLLFLIMADFCKQFEEEEELNDIIRHSNSEEEEEIDGLNRFLDSEENGVDTKANSNGVDDETNYSPPTSEYVEANSILPVDEDIEKIFGEEENSDPSATDGANETIQTPYAGMTYALSDEMLLHLLSYAK